jgi:hypothetical protein
MSAGVDQMKSSANASAAKYNAAAAFRSLPGRAK